MIKKFLEELGLKLEWYKYLSSTSQRQTMKRGFSQFAKDNLPICQSMTSLQRKYLNLKFDLHYAIDDYVILAQR